MSARGYDSGQTMYSPDGRVYQVEYAIETVKHGTLAVGVKVKDGIIFAVEEKYQKLQDKIPTHKIFQIDDHIGVAAAGYIPDARVQIDNARFFAQSTRLTYAEPAEVSTVAKHLADNCHMFTQYAGVRPFAISLIIAGVDEKGSSLYLTDPSGSYSDYKAVAIGSGSDEVTDFLEKNYKESSLDDAAVLAVAALIKGSDKKEETGNIKMARIKTDTKIFEQLGDEDIQQYANKAKESYSVT